MVKHRFATVQRRAYSPTTRQQAVEETPALQLLDTALLAVLSLLGGPAESNSRQQHQTR